METTVRHSFGSQEKRRHGEEIGDGVWGRTAVVEVGRWVLHCHGEVARQVLRLPATAEVIRALLAPPLPAALRQRGIGRRRSEAGAKVMRVVPMVEEQRVSRLRVVVESEGEQHMRSDADLAPEEG